MEETFILNPLDIIIAGIIGFGMWKGAKNGFIKGASRFLAIALGLIFGFRLRGMAETLYLDYLNLNLAPEMVAFLSFVTAFLVVFILAYTIMAQLSDVLSKMKIGMDNALGAAFGGVVATLMLSVAFILLSYVNFPSVENAKGSVLYPGVRNFSRYALGVGVDVLREANEQVNKYGITRKPAEDNPPPASQQPAEKPKAIR